MNSLKIIRKNKELILFKLPDNKELIEANPKLLEMYQDNYNSIANFLNNGTENSITVNELLSMELLNNSKISMCLGMYTKNCFNKEVPKDTLLYFINVLNPNGSIQYNINTNVIDTVDTVLYGIDTVKGGVTYE